MTLADGKRKVLMLLDEYSSGGEITQDVDINNKMADFFDMAQKDISQTQPVVGSYTFTLDGTVAEKDLPSGFVRQFRVWKDGSLYKKFPVIGGKLYVNYDSGSFIIEYIKNPTTIDSSTSDTYEFEVNELAANCLPFYVASQQIITDLVVDYSALWNIYLMKKASLPDSLPECGNGMVVQNFFGGRS